MKSPGILLRGERFVGGFLEGWTRSVGDPIISKWIVVILCVSMGLNAWLLNAARRGAMQPPQILTTKSAAEKSPVVSHNKPSASNLAITVSADKPQVTISLSSVAGERDDEKNDSLAAKRSGRRVRSMTECLQTLSRGRPQDLLDEEIIALTLQKKIPLYALEKSLGDLERAVKIRRAAVCIAFN